eukprot:CAMPEP_0205830192 /NCGR_PEP_ID=MMETSP0206-20130828/40339_1 /ASSEMBLY_ACC=CAM_ASM_000279 /TAXON_ID=36767 /ORGANISM="Euplotes focardii, Strain TN1" /LENGTH=66 /DNA_ID=CAMNT_0053133607 /DNA_START=36 /DNA_END=236 /DNA_ORIENTATION=+
MKQNQDREIGHVDNSIDGVLSKEKNEPLMQGYILDQESKGEAFILEEVKGPHVRGQTANWDEVPSN